MTDDCRPSETSLEVGLATISAMIKDETSPRTSAEGLVMLRRLIFKHGLDAQELVCQTECLKEVLSRVHMDSVDGDTLRVVEAACRVTCTM
jgi:hypothetical protein